MKQDYVFQARWKRVATKTGDFIGSFFLSRHDQKENSHRMRGIKNILVVRLDHWGDILTATAFAKALKEGFPGCRVIYLTSSVGQELLLGNPFVDQVFVWDVPWFSKSAPKRRSSGSIKNQLRSMKFDLGIAPRGDLRENWLLWRLGVHKRVGYGITGGGFFLTQQVPYRKEAHEREASTDLLKALGLNARDFAPQLYFSKEERGLFEKKMRNWGLDPSKRVIGFQAHAGASSKNWEANHIRTFLRDFSDRYGHERLVLVGTEGTRPSGPWLDLIGKTTVRELCLLMNYCKLFIGPDSGPTHTASCLGVPTLFLYSGTNSWRRWKPLDEGAYVIRKSPPCAPCARNTCHVAGHPCMSLITPEEVLRAAGEMLDKAQ